MKICITTLTKFPLFFFFFSSLKQKYIHIYVNAFIDMLYIYSYKFPVIASISILDEAPFLVRQLAS